MPGYSSNAARGADILIALGQAGPTGASLKELHMLIGDSKPALHRALSALASRGFVENAGRRGSYRLGPAVQAIARRRNSTAERLELMRPALYEISARTNHATFLMAAAGLDAVCLELVSHSPVHSLTGGTGGRVPMGIAAGSLAILSSLTPSARCAVITANATRYANYPSLRPMSAQKVQALVEETLCNGYSCDFGFFFPNAGGIGVAVPSRGPDSSGLAVAVSVHGDLYKPERLGQLADDVRNIIARLGIVA